MQRHVAAIPGVFACSLQCQAFREFRKARSTWPANVQSGKFGKDLLGTKKPLSDTQVSTGRVAANPFTFVDNLLYDKGGSEGIADEHRQRLLRFVEALKCSGAFDGVDMPVVRSHFRYQE